MLPYQCCHYDITINYFQLHSHICTQSRRL